MFRPSLLAAAALAAAAATTTAAYAIPLAANGTWAIFDVAFDLSGNLGWIDIADGSALSFTFSVPTGSQAMLTVVDGGYAGDRFSVTHNGAALGGTSVAANSYPSNLYLDFNAALANAQYSRGVFTLVAGSHSITGSLLSSSVDDFGNALNSTVGGIRLDITAVPEPGRVALLLGGLGLLGFVASRRRL